MKTITLEDPEFGGVYTVERRGDGALLLEPATGPSEAELLERADGRALTPEEFAEEFGDLPVTPND